MPPNPAGGTLSSFVDAARTLHLGVQSLITAAALVPRGGPVPPAVVQQAAGAIAQFVALQSMIAVGVDPVVRTGAVDILFALGREIAPFLFAPGWESDGWAPWAGGVAAAQVAVPEAVRRLAGLVIVHPQVVSGDPAGADAAAFSGGLGVLMVRGFGHANFDTQPPWSVRWIGGLPPGPAAPTCFVGGVVSTTGAFVNQVGGCAVLYYDTADPAAHDAALAAWLADPSSPPSFNGEVITIRWANGVWTSEGSAE